MMGGIFDQLGGKVIAFIGMGVVIGFLGVAMLMSKSVNLPQEWMFMRVNIAQVYASSPNGYADVSNQTLLDAGMVPKSIQRGNAIKNGFGGDITIAPGDDSTSFTFTVTNVPKSECVRLATADPSSWLSIGVNGAQSTDGDVTAIIGSCTDKSTLVFEAQ